jgi:hypothetical protein
VIYDPVMFAESLEFGSNTFQFGLHRFSRLILLGCALFNGCQKDYPITRVTVRVSDTFKGTLRLTPCVATAPDPAIVDDTGNGVTPECPIGAVELVVIKSYATITIPFQSVTVRRLHDGMPLTISAQIQ